LLSGEAEKFLFEDIYQVGIIWNGLLLFQYDFILVIHKHNPLCLYSCYPFEHYEEFILK
jgi:hypothetical protein